MKSSPKLKTNLFITGLAVFIILTAANVSHANVRCVQMFLAKTVFDPGPVDGAWGKKTASALSDYANYYKIEFANEINRKNAKALCEEIKKLDQPSNKAVVRKFQINILVDELEKFTGRRQLDLSKLNLLVNLSHQKCFFKISRKQIESKKIERLASGSFSVEGGVVKFGKNRWQTGGLADKSYLIEQGALAFTDDYLLHGTIPYFHLFVSPGEIAQKPMQIDFNGTTYGDDQNKLKPDEPWPKVYPFYVDTWQSGIIHFRC